MIDPNKYNNAKEFRQALDAIIKITAAAKTISIDDLRRQIVFNRFLARLDFSKFVLTGGYSLELRLPLSRSTTDIDLYARDTQLISGTHQEQNDAILLSLREQTEKNLHDYFSFDVERVLERLHGPKEGGVRCLIMSKVNNKEYYKFHVDVALCLEILEPDIIQPKNTLPFSINEEFSIFALQKEELFANKIHAYSRPRLTENSRVEDIIDMSLLIDCGLVEDKIRLALSKVFAGSADHQLVPKELKTPPLSWKKEFDVIAQRRNLPLSLNQAFQKVTDFYTKLNY